MTNKIVDFAVTTAAKGEIVSIEMLQNTIEKQLMIEGYYEAARECILYRAERTHFKEKGKEEDETLIPEPEASFEGEEKRAALYSRAQRWY